MNNKTEFKELKVQTVKPSTVISILVVISVLCALIMSVFNSANTNLPAYTKANTNVEPTIVQVNEGYEPPSTKLYKSEDINFSMPVPEDWTSITKNGNDSFIKQDGSIISIDIDTYNPNYNNVTQDSMSNQVQAAGGILGSFSFLDNSSYLSIYEIGTLDYFEYASWDLDHRIIVSITVPAAEYNAYKDLAIYLFNNISWEKENPIPEDYYMFYSSYGNFEFPVPQSWSTGISDGVFKAENIASGGFYTVSLIKSTYDFSNVSQIDFSQSEGQGKSGYIQKSYTNGGNYIISESTFTNNGVQMIEYHNYLATGEFQYEIDFYCPENSLNDEQEVYTYLQKYFRIF